MAPFDRSHSAYWHSIVTMASFCIIIIIIIIKKVKIIVTLSIKNTAGALYKSQIKGENRY